MAGQRVAIHLPAGGAAAEYVAVAADRVVPVPDGVPSDVAAALPLAGLVARRMLAKAGPLSGRRILATGVSGGVGQFVVQLAVAEGAQVTAVAAESEPWQHLPALGARVTHDVTSLDNGSFDIVLESVGGSLGSTAAKKLAHDGLFLWFGQASDQPLTLDFFSLFEGGQSLTLHHFVYFAGDTNQDARDLTAPSRPGRPGQTACRDRTPGRLEPHRRTPRRNGPRPPARQGRPDHQLIRRQPWQIAARAGTSVKTPLRTALHAGTQVARREGLQTRRAHLKIRPRAPRKASRVYQDQV